MGFTVDLGNVYRYLIYHHNSQ